MDALNATGTRTPCTLEQLEVRLPPGVGGEKSVEVREAEVGEPSSGGNGDGLGYGEGLRGKSRTRGENCLLYTSPSPRDCS